MLRSLLVSQCTIVNITSICIVTNKTFCDQPVLSNAILDTMLMGMMTLDVLDNSFCMKYITYSMQID